MAEQHPFTWRHFQAEIMFLCVRWSVRYSLSSRDLEEIMAEPGRSVDPTTISRWVQCSAPELEKRCRPHRKTATDAWRVDETAVKGKGVWMSLSRAVDSHGNTRAFLLSASRDAQAAKRLFAKALGASQTVTPRVITVDTNAASPKAVKELKAAGDLATSCELRQSTYLNNLVEHDHRFIKRLVKPGMGFFSDLTAWRTLRGEEGIHMMRKGQMQGVRKGDRLRQAAFIAKLFGVALSTQQQSGEAPFFVFLFAFLQHYRSHDEARQSLFEYLDVFYNRQRRHSSLGYLSPVAFEWQWEGSAKNCAVF